MRAVKKQQAVLLLSQKNHTHGSSVLLVTQNTELITRSLPDNVIRNKEQARRMRRRRKRGKRRRKKNRKINKNNKKFYEQIYSMLSKKTAKNTT